MQPRRRILIALIAIGVVLGGCRERPPGKLRIVPQLSPSQPRKVAFAPGDRELLAVLEAPGRVGLWDMRVPDAPVLIASFNAGALDLRFAPDGRSLVTTGFDGRVRRWTVDGQLVWVSPEGHDTAARAVAMTSDLIVSGSDRGELRLWTTEGAALGAPLTGPTAPVLSVAISPSGAVAAVATDGALRLWTRSAGEKQAFADAQMLSAQTSAPGPESPAARRLEDAHVAGDLVDVSATGAIGAALFDGSVRVWNPDGSPAGGIPAAHEGLAVPAVAFSPGGERIASGGADGNVRLWNADRTPYGAPIHAHDRGVYSLAFSRDGKRLATTGGDGRVRIWSVDGEALAELPTRQEERIATAALSPTELLVAVANDAGAVRLSSLDGGPTTPIAEQLAAATALAFAPVGDQFAVGYQDGSVRAWGADGEPRDALLAADGGPIAALAFRASWLAAGGRALRIRGPDGTVHDGQPIAFDSFTAIAWAPRELLVAGTRLGRVHVLNRDGSPRALPFKLPNEHVVALAFAEQGELFASAGGMESIVRLWRLDGTAQDPPLEGHLAPVTALASSPNASVLASGSADGTVRLWRLPSRVPEVVVDVGLPVDQVGYWRHALWVRAGESLSFFDAAGKPIAASLLRSDGALTFTVGGWFAGDIPVQAFDASRHALSARKVAERAVPEIIRATIQRGADVPSSLTPPAQEGVAPPPADTPAP